MPRCLALFLCPLLGLAPALAETPNLSPERTATSVAASQLILAHRSYRLAVETGDPVLLLAAIRLARGVNLRPALAWERAVTGEDPPPSGQEGPPDPASPEALAMLQGLAVDDPDLLDLAYDIGAQVPHGRLPVASVARSGLDGRAGEDWRLPLSGAVGVELALIGDGQSALGLTITDDTGALICIRPPTPEPGLCGFTPARNGFFTVHVSNAGAVRSGYLLVGN